VICCGVRFRVWLCLETNTLCRFWIVVVVVLLLEVWWWLFSCIQHDEDSNEDARFVILSSLVA